MQGAQLLRFQLARVQGCGADRAGPTRNAYRQRGIVLGDVLIDGTWRAGVIRDEVLCGHLARNDQKDCKDVRAVVH